MQVKVRFRNKPQRIFKTDGEAALSSDVMAGNLDVTRGHKTKAAAVQLVPRFDLLNDGDTGFRIDEFWYSTTDSDTTWHENLRLGDNTFDKVPSLNLATGRTWFLLDPEDLPDVTDISIDDGKDFRVVRMGRRLVDVSVLMQCRDDLLPQNQVSGMGMYDVMVAVNDVFAAMNPGMAPEDVASLFGCLADDVEYARAVVDARLKACPVDLEEEMSPAEVIASRLPALLIENPGMTVADAVGQFTGEGFNAADVYEAWEMLEGSGADVSPHGRPAASGDFDDDPMFGSDDPNL